MSADPFKAWMKQVDAELDNICGMSSDDLSDFSYREHFEDGYDPAETAQYAHQDARQSSGLPDIGWD